jgi:hypothetical protein
MLLTMDAVEVVATDEFSGWYGDLDDADRENVQVKVDLLQSAGVALGHPNSSAIEGCRYAIRELRIQSKGRPLRVFYAFDPRRNAVLLLGGDKTGLTDQRFYGEYVPKAERIWEDYLEETK